MEILITGIKDEGLVNGSQNTNQSLYCFHFAHKSKEALFACKMATRRMQPCPKVLLLA